MGDHDDWDHDDDDWDDDWDEDESCPECDGTGLFSRPACVIDGVSYPAVLDQCCEACDGTGYVFP